VLDGRKHGLARPGAALALVLVTVGVGLSGATPAAADPTKKDLEAAQAKADRLYHDAEIASERYNDAKVTLDRTRLQLRSLDADLDRQQSTVDTMRTQVAAMMVSQYQNGALSTASQVVLSDNPDAFLDNLGAVTAYNSQRGEVMQDYATEIQRLSLRKSAVKDELSSISALEEKLAAEKQTIDARSAEAKKALAGIKAELAPAPGVPGAPVAASGRAATAVRFAMAQIGKAYVFGAAGPNAYDCSGLTMAAWGQAGVGLPHSSSAQYGSGQHISESQLQPGDLVFYYSPISHVGMYIGGGKIVNALNPSAGIRISGLHDMPFSGAVRPGG
jgi:cell wall-associated NlpC family hydrolase